MPLYDYRCPTCGDFRAWRPMREAGDPVDCPGCGHPAGRAVTAPNLALMASHNRIAHRRNERSGHEPRVMSGERWRGASGGHGHRHDHGHRAKGLEPGLRKSHRPWSLGH